MDCNCEFPCPYDCLTCAPYRDRKDCNTCLYSDETCSCKRAAEAENRELVHNYFGLSYASYLVLPRVVLEQMDGEWQRRFTECLVELGESWKSEALPSYKVRRVEGECDRSCKACTDGPQPDADDCECYGECEREVADPLGEYRHPDTTFIQGLRRS